MNLILESILILLAGAVFSILPPNNLRCVWIGLLSQALSSICILISTIPILLGAPELRGELFWSYPVDRIGIHVDALGAFFLSFSLPMTFLGSAYALGYLAPFFDKKRHVGVHFAILNMVSLSFILIYTVENSLAFLLGWELAALSAWLAVIWDYKNQKIRFAGFNYLVSTHLSLLFLVAAFMIMGSRTGSFEFKDFQKFLEMSSPLKEVAFLLLLTSFGLKSAYFPFHTWLPRAHSAAPAHVSALMSGVIHKAGIYGILRFTLLIGTPERWMGWAILVFSTLSALMGVLYTATQRDLKRLLGYSSTENVGIVGIGIGVGYLGLEWRQSLVVALGFSGAILHVVNHALFKCLLFYAAGAIYRMTHIIDIEKLGGLIRKMPQTSFFFLLGGLAISALPPLNGFVSEFLIYKGLLNHGISEVAVRGGLVAVAAVFGLVGATSTLSMTRAFGIPFLGNPRDPKVEYHGEAPWSMRLTMFAHAIGIVAIGLFPILGIHWIFEPTRLFLKIGGWTTDTEMYLQYLKGMTVPLTQMGLGFCGLVIAVVTLRKMFLQKKVRKHVTLGCGYLAVNPRMQYTGSSFSDPFLLLFSSILRRLTRKKLPDGPFPEIGYVNSHYVDSVERQMFKVLGEGENTVNRWMAHLKEEPRFALNIGLLLVMILGFSIVVVRP